MSEPSFRLNSSGSIHSGVSARSHQRSEKPRGGKNERLVWLNDTAAVIRIGPSEKTYTKATTAHSSAQGPDVARHRDEKRRRITASPAGRRSARPR